jgi:hypothetical protein
VIIIYSLDAPKSILETEKNHRNSRLGKYIKKNKKNKKPKPKKTKKNKKTHWAGFYIYIKTRVFF